jgi:hypothetical protein
MKTGPDALGIAENESGSIKHENGTRRPRYRQKRVRGCKTIKRDPNSPEQPNTSPSAQNKKTGPDALGTAENESGHAKHENGTGLPRYHRKRVRERKTLKLDTTPSVPPKICPGAKKDPTPSVSPKTSLGAQNMKTGPEDLGTDENESGRIKHENGTRRTRYCQKRVRVCKT